MLLTEFLLLGFSQCCVILMFVF